MDKNAALIIVDMQNIFLRKNSELIPRVQALTESWPDQSKIYWLKYRNHPGSLFEKHLDWSAASVSPEIDLIEGAGQEQTFTHYGYAPAQDLIDAIKDKSISTAYVCGVDTDACVYAAMTVFWDNEIRPILLEHYTGSSGGQTFHEAAMALMTRQFGTKSIVSGPYRAAA